MTTPAYDLGKQDFGDKEDAPPYKDDYKDESVKVVPARFAGQGEESMEQSSSFFSDEKGNLKFVNFVVRYPLPLFLLMIFICIGSAFILIQLARVGGNPFTEDTSAYDIFDVRSITYDSLKLAKESVADDIDPTSSSRRLQEKEVQSEVGDITYWIYEAKTDAGLFTEEAIPRMRATEATILENKEYPKYCKLDYPEEEDPECAQPLSVMNIFYASSWNTTLADEIILDLTKENVIKFNTLAACVILQRSFFCDELDETYIEENKEWVNSTHWKIQDMTKHWDGKGELNDVSQVTTFIAHVRQLQTEASLNFFFDSGFTVDNPVVMYSRSILYWGELLEGTTTSKESGDKLKKFIIDNLYDEWTKITGANHNPEVQSYYFMIALIFDVILQILAVDGAKAFASFVFVFFYLRLMLGSWFLTAVGMFEIFMSVPLSWLFFSYVFQIKYFSTLNVLSIFIVIAIGADDIFVFMDAYKQSSSKGPKVLSSLESRMSYVFRRSGSAMLLTSATTCSAFLCTLASPIAGTRSFGVFAAFVILFDYILVMTLFCTSVVIYHNRFEGKPFCCNCTFWKRNSPTPTENALQSYEAGIVPDLDRISKFFKERFAPFILKGSNRIIIGIVLTTWMIVASIYTAKLEPTTSAEQFLDDNHPIQKAGTILNDKFPKTEEDLTSKIHFVWGLEKINRKGVNQLLNPDFVGNAAFAEGFSFNEECQTKMVEACESLQSDPALEEFILTKNGLRSVDCFVEELGAFNILGANATCLSKVTGNWKNQEWQIAPGDLASTIEESLSLTSCYSNDGKTLGDYYIDTLGWNGTALRFAGISVESSLLDGRTVQPEEVVRSHYNAFIKAAEDFDTSMQDACQSKVIMTDLDQGFIFMNNQRIYRTSGILGSMLGVLIAFGVLFIATQKLHITIFATGTILCVLISVVGSVTMLGWTLGVIEAILISILAGFSVDYVIHLAHAYVEAEGDTETRVVEAFGDMGISVFSGMLTSVVASIPLFFCTLVFFAKFGTFLCLTITLSWVFANFGFMSLLATFKIPMDKKCL